jgi:aminomuconate-semialdehyde/2-hydroxymuconate-6-semialdehyde dehydrogenase
VIKNVPPNPSVWRRRTARARSTTRSACPKGVIGVISPWNAPFLLMTWKVGPALACGNTVVVKPSEETPLTATLLGEVMNAVGIPKGVYNVVQRLRPDSAGEFLTRTRRSMPSPSPAKRAPARPS